jgi:hypothetical protein
MTQWNTNYIGMWNSTGFCWQPEEVTGVNLTCCSCFCLVLLGLRGGWEGKSTSLERDLKLLHMLWNTTWANDANAHWFVYRTVCLKFIGSSGQTKRGLIKLSKDCMKTSLKSLNLTMPFSFRYSDMYWLNCFRFCSCGHKKESTMTEDSQCTFSVFNFYTIYLVMASCSSSIFFTDFYLQNVRLCTGGNLAIS